MTNMHLYLLCEKYQCDSANKGDIIGRSVGERCVYGCLILSDGPLNRFTYFE